MSIELSLEAAESVHLTEEYVISTPVDVPQMQATLFTTDRSELSLPYDFLKLPLTPYQAGYVDCCFSDSLSPFFNQSSSFNRITPASLLLSSFIALLHRYTQQNLVHLDCAFLVNQAGNLPTVRVAPSVSGERSMRSLLQEVSGLLANLKVLPAVALDTPSATVAFTYNQQMDFSKTLLLDWEASTSQFSSLEQYDLHLQVIHDGLDIKARFVYNTHLFRPSTIERLAGHLAQMVEGCMIDLDRSIAELPLLTPAEVQQIQEEWSSLSVRYPQQPIFQIIERHGIECPNKIAVQFEDQHLTYAELNQKANQLAHYLIQLGVKPGVKVASCMEPSLEVLIGLLAIFKAGGIYVPLDPSHPADRLMAMLEDTQPEVLLTQAHLSAIVPSIASSTVCLDQDWGMIQKQPTHNPHLSIDLEQTAYIIYTSGTTGKPKGVMASHANLINYIWVAQEKYGFNSQDVMPAVARFTFSITMFELWSPLVAGGTLVVLARDHILDFKRMAQTLQEVTVVHMSPSLWRKLLVFIQELGIDTQTFSNLKHVSSGGDMVPADLLETLKVVFPNAEVYVIYGCSEISCMGCTYPVLRDRTITKTKVGKPFNNVSVRLFDPHRNLVPIGVVGEIYFGGSGITQGYLNREDLTQEKFVLIEGQYFYRTGDLGRWDEDGNLEILGRSDYQIKLRGIRIEPGDIEAALRQAPGVREGVVVARELGISGEKSLVAYVVPQPSQTLNRAEIRCYLQEKLPDYMVPSTFVVLDALPVNVNQKVDRQALPAPTQEDLAGFRSFVAPRDDYEQRLAEIWETLLEVTPIGVNDDFFEIGGDSLQSIALMMKIEETFGKTLPLSTLLTEPTIAQLANVLKESKPSDIHNSIVLLRKGGSKPPIFFIHDGEGETLLYRQLALCLKPDHPVYGIQPHSREGFPILHTRLPEMVDYYTEQIRSVQPEGPYLLSGLCIGGFLAFEVARKLQKEGQVVKMIALIDAADVKASVRPGLIANQRRDGFSKALKQAQELSLFHKWIYLLNIIWTKIINLLVYEVTSRSAVMQSRTKLKLFRYWLDRGWPLPSFLKHIPVRAALKFAEKEYVPEAPYPGEVLLFLATQKSSVFDGTLIDDTPYTEIYSDPQLGWQKRAEKVSVREMPGGHSSMLQEPNVQVMAEEMQAYIDAVL